MSDEADRADRLIEAALQDALAHARIRPRDAGPFTSFCYWCGMRVRSPRRWCSAECRDDWERHHAAARRR
jgi:hypothetical protein